MGIRNHIATAALLVCGVFVMPGCRSAGEPAPGSAPEAESEAVPVAEPADSHYWYAGISTIMIKPGAARTVGVNFHAAGRKEDEEELVIDDSKYYWTAADPAVVSVRGQGGKCVIMGKKEGSTMVVASNPGIPLPYAFRVICTEDKAVERSFQRAKDERTEGRLVGGWSNLEMAERQGE